MNSTLDTPRPHTPASTEKQEKIQEYERSGKPITDSPTTVNQRGKDSFYYAMPNEVIKFEYPLSERYRFFLRLEYLFKLVEEQMRSSSQQNSHAALAALLDIINIIGRTDIKTESIKELDRINHLLSAYQNASQVEQGTLDEILSTTRSLSSQLRSVTGAVDQPLRNVELLKILQQRNNIAGGMVDFDLPAYRHWLHQSGDYRMNDLNQWLEPFNALNQATNIILQLVRESTEATRESADDGIYKKNLDPKSPCQLIVVSLPRKSSYYAEFSGGKHRFTVRFMDTLKQPRPMQTQNRVEFGLSCCKL